ncbi:hypothetical protein V6N12_050860 [Hibiscus sabdariffa]|uniref:Uncharacterized protein n=1 Tax=Hibiscus sabdariffa TaxID=183260 RepID=A0ABR2GDY6_9ROSI
MNMPKSLLVRVPRRFVISDRDCDDKGDVSAETTGPARANFLADFQISGRASCCVIGLSRSPITCCLACTRYTSAESCHLYHRCYKNIFLARQLVCCIFFAVETLLLSIFRQS